MSKRPSPRASSASAKLFQARRLERLGTALPEIVRGRLPAPERQIPHDLQLLGQVQAPFGLQGMVKVLPVAGNDTVLTQVDTWWLKSGLGHTRHEVQSVRWQGASLVAQLSGVSDRDGAERLIHAQVLVPREAFPVADSDEVYWADLIGLQACQPGGGVLGVVVDVFDNVAHPVLEIEAPDARRFLVPMVARHVGACDWSARTIVLDWDISWSA